VFKNILPILVSISFLKMPILSRGKITCSMVLSYYTAKFLQGPLENLTSFLLLSKE